MILLFEHTIPGFNLKYRIEDTNQANKFKKISINELCLSHYINLYSYCKRSASTFSFYNKIGEFETFDDLKLFIKEKYPEEFI